MALLLGAVHLAVRPRTGTDLAAQVARASFAAEHPLVPVDLSWYAGVHPYGYSLLAPYVLAVVGIGLAGALAAVAAAALLGHLLRGSARPRAGAALGGVFAVANTVSGRTSFALGAVAALAALALLPRRPAAGVAAVLCGLLSPVAAAFLGLAAAVLVLLRRPGGWSLGLAAGLPVTVLAWLFPSGGVQPYEAASGAYAVAAGLALAGVTRSTALRLGGVLYAAAAALLLLLSDPFGSNVLRLGLLLAAPLVVATATPSFRVVAPVAAALVLWQVQPTYADLRAERPPPFDGLNAALVELDVRRVEVVPLRDHGEAASVAPVVPLARGWSRQVDTDRNALFYQGVLEAEEYAGWLRDNAVDAVAVARRAPVDFSGVAERVLLRRGSVPGLAQVWQDEHWTVFRPEPATAIAGPPVQVLDTDRVSVTLRAERAGTFRLAVRWSRWLSVTGPACIERDGVLTRLRFTQPGTARLASRLRLHPTGHCPDGPGST